MKIIINPADDVHLSDAFADHIRGSLGKVTQRFDEWLTRTEVFVKDVNGPKGGVDKHCRMEARPRGADPVVVDNQGADAYACISRTAEKLEKALEHRRGRLEARTKHAE